MIGPGGLRRTVVLILSLVLVMCLCMSTVSGEPPTDGQQGNEASDETKQPSGGSEAPQEGDKKDAGKEKDSEQAELVVDSGAGSDSENTDEGNGAGSGSADKDKNNRDDKDNKENKDESGADANGIEIHQDPPPVQPEGSGEGADEAQTPPKPQPETRVDTEPQDEDAGENVAHSYTARWSDDAFSDQTVNYRGELIIGTGASYTIDPVRDIVVVMDGKAVGRQKGVRAEYASSNTKYVQVDGSGHISGVKRGSAQVTVTIQFPDRTQKQLRKSVKVVGGPKISFVPNYAVLGNNGRLDLGQYANVPLLKASPNVDAKVTYSIEPVGTIKNSKVRLDKGSGKLSVTYQKPGEAYVITARTYGGEEATFTLYLGQRVQSIEIQSPTAIENGRAVIQAGQSATFKAVAMAADGEEAARQDVEWKVLDGDAAEIDRKGKLTATGDVVQERLVVIGAFAMDGSEAYATMEILVKPQDAD